MRQFHSYGPVDARYHFCVPRRTLVDQCINQLVGIPDEGGHYFTIWAARQTGKTWLIQQVMQEIPQRYGEHFTMLRLSFGWLSDLPLSPPHGDERSLPLDFSELMQTDFPGTPDVTTWNDFKRLFLRESSCFDRPLLLLIDEVDSVHPVFLDKLVRRFRELYLMRASHWLHGLALVGVRAVVGIESPRGSPFNVQRSLHVPNLTADEVRTLYEQYQTESGQTIDPAVVENVYTMTRGQPGLVSWFGMLLTKTYNPGPPQPIGMETWAYVWEAARFVEPNNTVINLIAKARMAEYQGFLVDLFKKADMPFMFHHPIHNHLYMHGIVEPMIQPDAHGTIKTTCRFTSPYIQDCLYQALGTELVTETDAVLALQPSDRLDDVFTDTGLNLPALLTRYTDYLVRLKARGINPWKAQPRRETDYQLTEAVGHFHLYAWLRQAIGKRCVVSPEFPTGNGKVDIHVQCDTRRGVIEVKSFVDRYQLDKDKPKAASYAKQVGLDAVTMAVFIPVLDEETLTQLSGTETHDGVQVHVVMIGWF